MHARLQMSDTAVHQSLIVPLFGIGVANELRFGLCDSEFVERLTIAIYPKPIQVYPKPMPGVAVAGPSDDNKPIPTPLPAPAMTVKIIPWAPKEAAASASGESSLYAMLPDGFDVFDNIGQWALRAGPGALGGSQTVTTTSTRRVATSLLVLDFDQAYPVGLQSLMGSANPYESNVVASLLDGMRLSLAREPHPYKGFHVIDGHLVDGLIKWPLIEVLGDPTKLEGSHLAYVKDAFLQAWRIRAGAERSKACKIVALAMEYYYLSSTMMDTRTIFIQLMIAFEALFKRREEDSASKAADRLGRLLAGTKEQYNQIKRFMWNTDGTPGCCQLRNEIVHGGTGSLEESKYSNLRDYVRRAIMQVTHLVLSRGFDHESYYESLRKSIDTKFANLPNT